MDAVKFEVPPELFVTAESSSFAGQLNLGTLDAGPDTYRFKKPIDWNVTVSNTGDALLVMGRAHALASVPCARCLDDFDVELDGEVEGYFLLSPDDAAPEDMEDDEFEVLGADKVLDLEPLIVAAILVEAPLVPLCREDCAGLCAQCGANLNEGPCACQAQPDDDLPRMSDGRVSPFAALKDINFGQ